MCPTCVSATEMERCPSSPSFLKSNLENLENLASDPSRLSVKLVLQTKPYITDEYHSRSLQLNLGHKYLLSKSDMEHLGGAQWGPVFFAETPISHGCGRCLLTFGVQWKHALDCLFKWSSQQGPKKVASSGLQEVIKTMRSQ